MIGRKIKELRRQRGMSMSNLASEAEVSKSYLSELEKDLKINPSIAYVKKIASVLEVDVEELLAIGSGNNQINQKRSLDNEWIHLMNSAIKRGLTKEQFRAMTQSFKGD